MSSQSINVFPYWENGCGARWIIQTYIGSNTVLQEEQTGCWRPIPGEGQIRDTYPGGGRDQPALPPRVRESHAHHNRFDRDVYAAGSISAAWKTGRMSCSRRRAVLTTATPTPFFRLRRMYWACLGCVVRRAWCAARMSAVRRYGEPYFARRPRYLLLPDSDTVGSSPA